jgi:hypothetical protein
MGMDDLAVSVYWFLLRSHHQLSWASLIDVAIAVKVESDSCKTSLQSSFASHEYHAQAHVRPLVECLRKHDGTYWDLRTGFYGMEDSIRLHANLTKSIKSPPAVTWRDRVYFHLVDRGCHSDEIGIDLEELCTEPSLQRPLSLQLSTDTPKGGSKSTRTVLARDGATAEVIPPLLRTSNWDQCDFLRRVLEADPRFDVRYNNQLEKVDKRAAAELHARNGEREEVLTSPGKKLHRERFATIWAVFLRELPQYFIRYYGVSSSYTQSQLPAASIDSDADDDVQEANPNPNSKRKGGQKTIGRQGQGQAQQQPSTRILAPEGGSSLTSPSPPFSTQAGAMQDLADSPGMTACGVTLHRRRIRHITDNYAESREDEIWRWAKFVGNSSLRVVGEYMALIAALKQCSAKGYAPVLVQTATKDIPKAFRSETPTFKSQSILTQYHICKELVQDLQAQARKTHFLEPEYYNILGLPTIKSSDSQKKKGAPKPKLLKVTGSPSTFAQWSDEVHESSAIGEFCRVDPSDVVRFEVLKANPNPNASASASAGANSKGSYSYSPASSYPALEAAQHLARTCQDEGYAIARGWTGPVYSPAVAIDVEKKFNSLLAVPTGLGLDGYTICDSDDAIIKRRAVTAADPKPMYRACLPGLGQAEALVHSLAGAWDKAVVGTQVCEASLARRKGLSSDGLMSAVLTEQPAHRLR